MKFGLLMATGAIIVGVLAIWGIFLVFSGDPVVARSGQALILVGVGVGFLTLALRAIQRRRSLK